MKYRVLFTILALLALTTLSLGQPAQFNFEYPGDWDCPSHMPLTYNACFDTIAGTPIPNGTMLIVYVNDVPYDSFEMNSDSICFDPGGGFFVQWCMTIASPGETVYLEVQYGDCRYWINSFVVSGGHQTFALAESDWNCDCGPPAPCYFTYPGDGDCAYPPDAPLSYGGCWEGIAIPDGTPIIVYKNDIPCDTFAMNSDSVCTPPTYDGGFFVQLDSCVGFDGDSLYCEVEYDNYRYWTRKFEVTNAPARNDFLLVESDWFCECDGLFGSLSGSIGPGVYHVCDAIQIDSDSSLRLMPGTTIIFDGPYSFSIYGTLLAEGTEDSSIVFTTDTVANPNRWRGLRFYSGGSGSQLAYCVIENSLASGSWPDNAGGGVYCQSLSPSFTNCTIRGNEAYKGGGVFCEAYSSPEFINCIFSGNLASNDGGGLSCEYHSSPTFTNCTISANSASSNGGGIACELYSDPTATNVIIWDNCAGNSGDEVYIGSGSSVSFECCDVDSHGVEGMGTAIWLSDNIFTDPLFCNPEICTNAPTTMGDYHIFDISPCAPAQQPECGLIGAFNVGCYWEPAPVKDLTVLRSYGTNDVILRWSPVDTTMHGDSIDIELYFVYFREDSLDDPISLHGATADTFYIHYNAVLIYDAVFYEVTAYTGSIGLFQGALDELGEHPRREDLTKYLRQSSPVVNRASPKKDGWKLR